MYQDGGSYRELLVAPASLREQLLMYTRKAFKRRGNMSSDDSRAGNATNACAQCLNRVRGDMRIVCLITVGAFLLSIAIAESDVPIGSSQYHQRPRIILEPVKTQSDNESNPFNWLINMLQKVIDPPKKSPPSMVGPINLPGLGGHIYIRQKERTIMPWESSNRVIIKLVSRDPVTGNVMPIDSLPFHHRPEESSSYHHRPEDHSSHHHRQEDHSSHYHQPEDPSRRATKTYGYAPVNHNPLRPINNIQQNNFAPVSPQPQYSSWNAQQQRSHHHQNYVPQYSKPFRPSSPNDFHYDNYGKVSDQGYGKGYHEDYFHRRPNRMSYYHRFNPGVAQPMNAVPLTSMYRSTAHQPSNSDPVYSSNEYNDQFKDSQNTEHEGEGYYAGSGKPDFQSATQLPYPEYPGLSDEELQGITTTKADNVSHVEHTSPSPFKSSYRNIVRADRMVPVGSHRNDFGNFSNGWKSYSLSRGSNRSGKSRRFKDGTRFDAKFEAGDVGGIEVITAPNLQRGREDFDLKKSRENNNLGSTLRESDLGLNVDEDSISMSNGKNLARGESVEYPNEQNDSNDEEKFVPILKKAQTRRSSYKVINRVHRNQGNNRQSNLTENNEAKEISAEIIGDRKDHLIEAESNDQNVSVVSEVDENATVNDVISEVGQKIVMVTPSNYRRMQIRRKPRVVKAIYRRKPVTGIIKSSAESVESSDFSEEKNSRESLSTEN